MTHRDDELDGSFAVGFRNAILIYGIAIVAPWIAYAVWWA
jgi:hypothetical protein